GRRADRLPQRVANRGRFIRHRGRELRLDDGDVRRRQANRQPTLTVGHLNVYTHGKHSVNWLLPFRAAARNPGLRARVNDWDSSRRLGMTIGNALPAKQLFYRLQFDNGWRSWYRPGAIVAWWFVAWSRAREPGNLPLRERNELSGVPGRTA